MRIQAERCFEIGKELQGFRAFDHAKPERTSRVSSSVKLGVEVNDKSRAGLLTCTYNVPGMLK
jgi:hypothetical protein